MTSPQRHHRYSYEEYLAYEQDSGLKHGFEDGEIFAMPGGSRRHNALALRVGAAVDAGRRPGCIAFQSDQKVRVLATGKATYPDVSLVCGPIEGDPADPSGNTVPQQDSDGLERPQFQYIPLVLGSARPPEEHTGEQRMHRSGLELESVAFAVDVLELVRVDGLHRA